MINLLPLKEKIKVRSEYRLRLFTVIGIMVLVLVVSALIPLVISYFVISYNVNFINDVADKLKNSESFKETDAVIRIIKDANKKSILLNDPTGVSARQNILGSFSSIFKIAEDIRSAKEGVVKVTQVAYDQLAKKPVSVAVADGINMPGTVKESGIHRITVKGFASDRNIFLVFLEKLGTDRNFLNIDSPVSNLVNSSNVDFSLVITLKDKAI